MDETCKGEEEMKLINEWLCLTNVVSDSMCEKLITLGKNKFESAQIADDGLRKGKGGVKEERRKSKVVWIGEQWVYDLISPFMKEANKKSGWNFDITACEAFQLTKYEKGDFFKWHIDGHSDSLSTYDKPENKILHNTVRKISMTVLLNDDYEGGEFQFGSFNRGEVSVSNPKFSTKGSIIFFPSFMHHQVAPVTEGIRYSLVAWFVGPSFK